MKLFYAPPSPFVRKCLVAARELGLINRIELVPAVAHPVNRDRGLVAHNPLGKIPTLITGEGTVLYDSRVICEYLDSMSGGGLIPRPGAARWMVLVEQALADGVMDAAVLVRYELGVRPEALRWNGWVDGQLEKVTAGVAEIERRAEGFGTRVDIGTIAVACALGYLDFRFATLGWRAKAPTAAAWFESFNRRDSMRATHPPPA